MSASGSMALVTTATRPPVGTGLSRRATGSTSADVTSADATSADVTSADVTSADATRNTSPATDPRRTAPPVRAAGRIAPSTFPVTSGLSATYYGIERCSPERPQPPDPMVSMTIGYPSGAVICGDAH